MSKTNNALAKLLGQDGNIIVPKAFADLMGSLDGGAVLVDLAYWQGVHGDWFWRTDALIAERQRVSSYAAKQARARLAAAGLLEMDMRGQPAKAHYRLDLDAVLKLTGENSVEPLRARPYQLMGSGPTETGGSSTGEIGGSLYIQEKVAKEVLNRAVPLGTAQAANDAAPRAPLAAHTNGSTQPEPLASPGLPSVAVNGASPAAAGDLAEPHVIPAKPKRSARNGKAPQPPEYHALIAALAEVCRLDLATIPQSTRVKLDGAAKSLFGAGVTADFVQEVGTRWYSSDWRGKQGKKPTLAQLQEEIGDARLQTTRAPGHYPRYGVHDAPARVKMSEVF